MRLFVARDLDHLAKRTGSHGALLQMIWIVRMRRQYKNKQKAQSSDKDLCNLTVFNCVYILSVRTESGIKKTQSV